MKNKSLSWYDKYTHTNINHFYLPNGIHVYSDNLLQACGKRKQCTLKALVFEGMQVLERIYVKDEGQKLRCVQLFWSSLQL